MTKLKQAMIDAMLLHGFSVRTQESYLSAVSSLASYYNLAPDRLSDQDIQAYFLYLVKERHYAAASCSLFLNGIHFFYRKVLQRDFKIGIQIPKKEQRIPELLTRKEVAAILSAAKNPKHNMLLSLCYACGLRVSELMQVAVKDIDGERKLLHVHQGKGAKDRQVIISDTLLMQLREYWQSQHPGIFLFPGRTAGKPLSVSTADKCFHAAKESAQIQREGGMHSLRHAYATHQLAAGLPINELKQQMGHNSIHTTLRYIHWIPNYQQKSYRPDLLALLAAQDEATD